MKGIMVKSSPLEKRERKVGYFQTDPSVVTLYLGNLKYTKSEKEIQELLGRFGSCKYVRLVVDPKTDKTKGIAFAQMPNKKHALEAIEKLNGSQLDGRTLKVSIANDRIGRTDFKSRFIEKEVDSDDDPISVKKPKRRKEKGLKVLFNYLDS